MTTADDKRRAYHKRHPDWIPFDEIHIRTVPRYKTSGLSGDEWRVSAAIEFSFKGVVVFEESFTRMKYAVQRLAVLYADASCPIPNKVLEVECHACDQVGCSERAVARYWLKEEFSERGEKLDASEWEYHRAYRQFCKRHLRRGDCGREDSDGNYELDGDIGPAQAEGWERDVSEAGCVVVEVSSPEEVPAAVERVRRGLRKEPA